MFMIFFAKCNSVCEWYYVAKTN